MNDKCYKVHDQYNINCLRKTCRHYIDHEQGLNCTFITLNRHPKKNLTLTEVGNVFNVTRMRICQIEKNARKKCQLQLDVIKSRN